MNRLIFPGIFGAEASGFFTGRDPGSDVSEISLIFGIPKEHIYMPVQKHTDFVQVLEDSTEPKVADAVITSRRGVLVGVRTADCVPIILFDGKGGVSGAVHAGWRGTAAGILTKTVEAMAAVFSSRPSDILVAIGPSIRGCCYETDGDVYRAVKGSSGEKVLSFSKNDKYHIDLSVANRLQALSSGIPDENIWVSEDCTFCNPQRYFSYRHSKEEHGRQGGFIGLL